MRAILRAEMYERLRERMMEMVKERLKW